MRKSPALLAVCLATFCFDNQIQATDLNKLIPSLYGAIPGTPKSEGQILVPDNTPGDINHAAHFTAGLGPLFNISSAIGSGAAQYPVGSAVGAFTVQFDPKLGSFVNTTETLGPLFAERAETLGRGKLDLGFSATFFHYDTLDGKPLNNFKVTSHHGENYPNDPDPGTVSGFEKDLLVSKLDVNIDVQIFSLAATYGITDHLDVGVVIPIVHIDMDVHNKDQIIVSPDNTTPNVHRFSDQIPGEHVSSDFHTRNGSASGSSTGVGDMVVRAKYDLFKSDIVHLAGAVQTQLPTGDESNFLGSGAATVKPLLVMSRTFALPEKTHAFVTPHLNLGYQFNLRDGNRDALEYVAGFDVGVKRLTLAFEVLGTHDLYGDGIDKGTHERSLINASVGLKWNPFKRFIVAGNVQVPLNREGIRSDVIPTLGVEYSF